MNVTVKDCAENFKRMVPLKRGLIYTGIKAQRPSCQDPTPSAYIKGTELSTAVNINQRSQGHAKFVA